MNKIKTGIEGLDEMLGGGLVEGRPYIIAGGPGAGKTILGMQFLLQGIKNRERAIYVSLEETAEQLRDEMAALGWDITPIKILDTTQELGMSKWVIKADNVISKPEFTLSNLMKILSRRMESYKPRRMVIDSVTSIRLMYEKKSDMRREILAMMNFLSMSECTTLLTSEVDINIKASQVLMEEFLASGVIKLHTIDRRGEIINAISIEKIRGTDFDKHLRPLRITDEGIVVFPGETVFE